MSHTPALLEELNERELEIIPLLAEGLTNKEIANRLFLAPNTVKWYIRQLNSKFDTSSRDEIVERAEALGLMISEKTVTNYVRPRQNLPHQTTPFIGRDAELDDIHRIIERPDVRLLTILAPGGMGKTRIALEATEQQINHFPDGVYFVPLQPLNDISNIVPQIATAIGFQFGTDGTTQKEQMLRFLSDKKLLLCMDNWEHLLEGVPLVNEILSAAPDVKIIATSREKLNLLIETTYILKGMSFPDWETPEDALEYDAVQLLVQTAQRIKLDWQLTDSNLDHVARICRLTEGMPLGILLAVSWLDVYSLGRIAEEIQKNADILESDMRDVPDRQRSISAVFNYSWNKLNPQEQSALMKMSVFKGGCSLTAAEAVTGVNARILQGLVNKSLLSRNIEGRYEFHELLRQYAEANFKQTTDVEVVRDAHMAYYADALHQLEPELEAGKHLEAHRNIAIDFENVRLMWLRAVEREQFDLIEKVIYCLRLYASHQELGELFTIASQKIAPLVSDTDTRRIYAKIESTRAHSHYWQPFEDATEMESSARDAVGVLRQLKDQWALAHSLLDLGLILFQHGKLHEAIAVMKESLDLCLKVNWKQGTVVNYQMLGMQYNTLGLDPSVAQTYLESAYQLAKDTENIISTTVILSTLAGTAIRRKDLHKAREYYRQAYALAHEHTIALAIVTVGASLARVEAILGDLKTAEEIAQEARQYVRNILNKDYQGRPFFALSLIAILNGDNDKAVEYAETAYRYSFSDGIWGAKVVLSVQLGLALAISGRFDDALNRLTYWLYDDTRQIHTQWDSYQLCFMHAFAFILADSNQDRFAVEILGASYNYSYSSPLFMNYPALQTLQQKLKDNLSTETFTEAFEHGKTLDLEQVVYNLQKVFPQESQ